MQNYKLRKQIGELEGSLVPIKRLEELEADRRMDVFEIFREHMIDRLYLDLAEETSDLKIYGKLLQACKSAAEELFREDRVNELCRDLRVRMKNNFFFQSYREKQRYESGSRFAK